MRDSLGLVEVGSFAGGLVVLDVMDKAADVRVMQAELNDLLGVQIKITGQAAATRTALEAGRKLAEQMKVSFIATAIHAPADAAWPTMQSQPEHSPLLEADVVYFPKTRRSESPKEKSVSENGAFAIGLIETQGLTAVLEALDAAAKAGNIEVVGREKLGGGYVTVIFKGDVAAVKAAVEAGQSHVDGLGKLIAAHVIARPSEAVLSLLPKS